MFIALEIYGGGGRKVAVRTSSVMTLQEEPDYTVVEVSTTGTTSPSYYKVRHNVDSILQLMGEAKDNA